MKICRNLSELAREVKVNEFICEEKFVNNMHRGLFFISNHEIEFKVVDGKTLFLVKKH